MQGCRPGPIKGRLLYERGLCFLRFFPVWPWGSPVPEPSSTRTQQLVGAVVHLWDVRRRSTTTVQYSPNVILLSAVRQYSDSTGGSRPLES